MFLKQFILVASSLGACAEYKKIPQQQTFQQYQIVFCNTTPNQLVNVVIPSYANVDETIFRHN